MRWAANSGPPAVVNRTLVRGDTFVFLWRWSSQTPEGVRTPYDLTGYTSRFTVRNRQGGALLMEATTDDGITLNADGADGWVRVTRPPATTATLPPGTHEYDQEFTAPDGTVSTPVKGTLTVIADNGEGHLMPAVIETTVPLVIVEIVDGDTELIETERPLFVIEVGRADAVVVEVESPVSVVEAVESPPEVVEVAYPGTATDGPAEIETRAFAFGDAAHAYYFALVAGRVVGAEITYRTAFDAPASVLVGTGFGNGSILTAGDSDPATVGTYGAACDVALAAGAGVWITITPAGASQGAGVLTLFLSFD